MNEREYDRMYEVEDRHWWYVALHELIHDVVAREKPAGGLQILDAGCGTGRLCQLLAPHGSVVGCDLNDRALAFSRSRGVSVFKADLGHCDLGEERFDVVTSIDVLYHRNIPGDAPVLARLYRALKPGGLLVLNLVAFEQLRSTHDIAVHTRKRYRRSELVPVLEREGFVVEKASYRLAFLFMPILVLRLAKRILRRQVDDQEVRSDVGLPSPTVNWLLLWFARLENHFLETVSFPCGSSLFVTARKPLTCDR